MITASFIQMPIVRCHAGQVRPIPNGVIFVLKIMIMSDRYNPPLNSPADLNDDVGRFAC